MLHSHSKMAQSKGKTLQKLLFVIICNITSSHLILHEKMQPYDIQNTNITVLHKVFEDNKNEYHTEQSSERTEDVLPIKLMEKYSLDDDILFKDNNMPLITFDFNFDDLEELSQLHVSKKFNLQESRNQMEDKLESSNNGYTRLVPATYLRAENLEENTLNNLPEVVTLSPHIFKILSKNTKNKDHELLTHIEETHLIGNVSALSNICENGTQAFNSTINYLPTNIFHIITRLFDHFYWDITCIRRKVTTACGLEMRVYLNALHDNFDWAQKAYDTSGHYRGQFLFGNDKWLGIKNFCEELNHEIKPESQKDIEFQFFTGLISLKLWLPKKKEIKLILGECLPKTCTTEDIQAVLTLDPHLHTLHSINTSLNNETNDFQVQVLNIRRIPGSYNIWQELKFQILLSIIILIIGLIGISSWYHAKLTNRQKFLQHSYIRTFELHDRLDVQAKNTEHEIKNSPRSFRDNDSINEFRNTIQDAPVTVTAQSLREEANSNSYGNKEQGWYEQFLLCFAFQTNAGAILNIDKKKESKTSCVHGIRVLSLLWTILVHTYLQIFAIGENRYQRVIVERSIWYQSVGNATFSVDTFFFISGFLVTLLFFEQEHKKTKPPKALFSIQGLQQIILLVFYRYVRLTPAYLFTIVFNDLSLRQMADNSVFLPSIPPNTCRDYWWRNLLYINNFYPLNEICMIWSWYMANDMQFYTMATILLMLSLRNFKLAVLILLFILLSSWGVTGVISIMHHYKHKVGLPFESFDFLYDKPWQRVGTYIIGMITGYIVYRVRVAPKLWVRMNFWLWAGSLILMCLIVFGVWNGELSILSTAFYVSIGHTAFGMSLVWIVLSCVWGLAPTVNCILSYRALWPLSRLTYCTYLIHPLIMLIFSFHMSGTVYLNNAFMLIIFLGNVVVAFVVAFFVSIIFEAPIIRIIKFILKKA